MSVGAIPAQWNNTLGGHDADPRQQLYNAAERGSVPAITAALQARVDINSKDWYGWTALHWAVSANKSNAVTHLIRQGANVSAMDSVGDTALHWAAQNSNHEISRVLLTSGASTDLKNRDGLLPIDLCTDHAMRDMCRPVNAVPQQQLQQTMAAGQQYGLQQTMAVAPGAVGGLGLQGDNAESIVNSLLALLAAEQRARSNIQRKHSGLSELKRTMEDIQSQLRTAHKSRKDAEQRLQDIRPTLERERRRRNDAEAHVRDKRQQLEDVNSRLEDANEKMFVARKYANQMQILDHEIKAKRIELGDLRGKLEDKTGEKDELDGKVQQLDRLLEDETNKNKNNQVNLKDLNEKNQRITQENKTVKEQVVKKKQDLNVLNARINTTKGHRDKAKNEAEGSEKQGRDFQSAEANHDLELRAKESDHSKADSEKAELEASIDNLETEKKEKEREVEELERRLAELQASNRSKRDQKHTNITGGAGADSFSASLSQTSYN